jgi:signal transduction histidine kinase
LPNADKPNPRESTDDGLRQERRRADVELATSADTIRDIANKGVTDARQTADQLLQGLRVREDRDVSITPSLTDARARQDAELETARHDADALVREEIQQRQVALASLLAFERERTDLHLETERLRAEQALTSRQDFMAMVSHDMRSLLGAIALSAEMLKAAAVSADPMATVDNCATRILRFSARMNRLVGDLMDLASIEAGKLCLVRVRRNAALLLRDSMEAFQPAAAAGGIELCCEAQDAPLMVEIDHERILQVLTNLVGNALKFTPPGGRIVIRFERRGDDVCFTVADSGVGIAADQLDKVFDRYFQSEETDRRGLGLGLFIAKSIVEGHGGRIWAESTPGIGSTFHVALPA